MARKKKDDLSAFSAALDDFGFNNHSTQDGTTNIDDIFDDDDIDNLDDNDNTDIVDDNTNVEDNSDNQQTNVDNNVLNNNSTSTDDDFDELNNTDDSTNVDENEMNQIGLFFDAFAEELGWDVEDDDRPTSVEGLVDYIGQVISENSTPQYADERIAKLDAYVKNGGKFEDYYSRQQDSLSLDNMDLEDESNQRAAVRELLRYQGYNDDQINRRIERFEDSDMLEEEATDAVEMLKDIRKQELEEYERQQEAERQDQLEKAHKFMSDLTTTINSLDNVRGIAIPKADRKQLFDYITKVDANGLTQYQKDFNSNMVNNLIESAYFTMKGDTLLGEAKRSGRTSAANKLRTMLRHQSTNHSRYNVDDSKQRSVVDIASQFYR